MALKIAKQASFQLAKCRVSPSDNCIIFEGNEQESCVSLQPKFIEVLDYLARHYPKVVTREELIDAVWEGNRYVGSKALTNAIWHLRQQLGAATDDEPVIETVRKAGYRLLIAPEFDVADLVSEPDLLLQAQERLEQSHSLNRRIIYGFSVLLLVLLSVLVTHLYQDSVRYVPTERQQLTSDAGAELYPVVSPDGRWLVYGAKGGEGNHSLYLKDLHTPADSPKRLTASDSSELRAVWSIDGASLYYPSFDKRLGCQLHRLELNSNEARAIAPCSSNNSALDMAPSGDRLAYISGHEKNKPSGLYFLALETGAKPSRYSCVEDCSYRDRDLAFSPDGRYMAIARRFGNISEDIFVVELSTGVEHRLTRGFEDIRGITWHKDSDRLVFSSENSGIRNGYIVSLVNQHVQSLSVEGMSYPRFIPDSTELVYANYMKDYQITVLGLEQSVATAPFPLLQTEYSYRNPDYSAVAKRIVYVSNETGFNEIWSASPDGSDRRQHTDLKRRVAYPSWSHDGTKVAFLAPDDKSEGNKIHVLDLNANTITILTSSYLDHERPSWGWQDHYVLASTSDGLTQFYLDNRRPTPVGLIDVRIARPIDENTLLLTRPGFKGLWRISLSEPSQVESVISGEAFFERYNWVVTAKGVYFRQSHSSYQQIVFWRFSTELLTPIIKLPPYTIPRGGSLTYLPQAHSLLLTQSENYKRDVIRLQHKLLL